MTGTSRSKNMTKPITTNCMIKGKGIELLKVCSLKLQAFQVKTARIPNGVVKFQERGKKHPRDFDIFNLMT